MANPAPPRIPQILICDDDSIIHLSFKRALKTQFGVRSAYNGDEALAIIRNHPIDIVLLDVQMRSPDEGLQYIERLKQADPEIAIIMTSGLTDFATVREAMKRGATDYLSKTFEPEELPLVISQALERRALLQRNDQQNFEVARTQRRHSMVGRSPALEKLRVTLSKFRNSPANVLITGETGTGKEVFARQLRGELADGTLAPFIAVDSSTIQSTMAESILFGFEKGAFTGAEKATKGIFEEANGGIVYFDEIGNMPLEIQSKLLRVLQEKEVTRLGSAKVIPLEFRVVCATNKDLDAMVAAREFKEDLLQRINVLPAAIPPLRERKEDIAPLLDHSQIHAVKGRALRFSEDAVSTLQSYPWPGNVRELGNLVAYLAAMVDSDTVETADLPPKLRDSIRKASSPGSTSPADPAHRAFYPRLEAFETQILREEYEKHGGNISRMALTLEMDRSHLYSKLRQYGIHSKKSE